MVILEGLEQHLGIRDQGLELVDVVAGDELILVVTITVTCAVEGLLVFLDGLLEVLDVLSRNGVNVVGILRVDLLDREAQRVRGLERRQAALSALVVQSVEVGSEEAVGLVVAFLTDDVGYGVVVVNSLFLVVGPCLSLIHI